MEFSQFASEQINSSFSLGVKRIKLGTDETRLYEVSLDWGEVSVAQAMAFANAKAWIIYQDRVRLRKIEAPIAGKLTVEVKSLLLPTPTRKLTFEETVREYGVEAAKARTDQMYEDEQAEKRLDAKKRAAEVTKKQLAEQKAKKQAEQAKK